MMSFFRTGSSPAKYRSAKSNQASVAQIARRLLGNTPDRRTPITSNSRPRMHQLQKALHDRIDVPVAVYQAAP